MLLVQVTLTAIALGVAPARDETLGPNSCTRSWQRDRGHSRADGGRRAQFNQHDVVINGSAIVLGVADDLGRVNKLLVAFDDVNVVFSQTHLDSAGLKDEKVPEYPS